jgi:tetratricopeptide (TPR) repeat protein
VPSEISQISVDQASGYEAVKLFVERAQKAKPNFVLTEENAESIAEICARLDGLPLAIELAAARVKILTPQLILTKLENRLKLLIGGASDLPARQQTMRGAVEWSYELLSEDEKKLFRRLSVFARGFRFGAAETVCTGLESDKEEIEFLDLLTSLVDKSLLFTKEQSEGSETQFGMLEVVREYALESLVTSGEAETIRHRHSEYFLALGEEAEPHLQTLQGAEWLNRLEEEHDNIRAALNWSLENDPETAARLAGSLRSFWNFHGHLTEGRQWLEKVLDCKGDISMNTQWKILYGLGLMATLQGNYQSAQKFYEQSRETATLAGDQQGAVISGNNLAFTLMELGNLREAKSFVEESLSIGKDLNDKFLIARAIVTAGELARSEDDYEAARQFYEEALEVCEQVDMKNLLAGSLINLGAVAYIQGDFKISRSYYEKGLKTCQEVGLKVLTILCLEGFAALAAKQGELELAVRLSGVAEVSGESMGYVSEKEDRRFRDTYLTELKAKMDEAEFSKFYEQGRKMKIEQAIALIGSS